MGNKTAQQLHTSPCTVKHCRLIDRDGCVDSKSFLIAPISNARRLPAYLAGFHMKTPQTAPTHREQVV
jgi:hypothetical protein